MIAATRSEPECSASEMIAMDPEMMPTVSLKAMSAELDAMEIAAARAFSRWLPRSLPGAPGSGLAGVSNDALLSQAFKEGPPGQCAVAGLVLQLLRPLRHSEV